MSYKKLTIATGIMIGLGCSYYLYSNFQTSEPTSPEASSSTYANPTSADSDAITTSQDNQHEDAPQEAASTQEMSSSNRVSETSQPDQFLVSDVFSSPENLDKAFIQDDGAIKRGSLLQAFQQEDFEQLVSAVRNTGYDESSLSREALLSNHLVNTLGSEVFQSDYSCSGSICALTFQSTEGVSDETLHKLADFDKNNSFTDTATNDLGETTVKALYIATDDPGTLSLVD